jgi:hypothetical protein
MDLESELGTGASLTLCSEAKVANLQRRIGQVIDSSDTIIATW